MNSQTEGLRMSSAGQSSENPQSIFRSKEQGPGTTGDPAVTEPQAL